MEQMKTKIILLMLFWVGFAQAAFCQKEATPYLQLKNNEGVIVTQKDAVVSKKLFNSSVVMLQSDEEIPRGTDIMLMLGEEAVMFQNKVLTYDIMQQIVKSPVGTQIVFSLELKTGKELKLMLVE
jgi:hypothetical protein